MEDIDSINTKEHGTLYKKTTENKKHKGRIKGEVRKGQRKNESKNFSLISSVKRNFF